MTAKTPKQLELIAFVSREMVWPLSLALNASLSDSCTLIYRFHRCACLCPPSHSVTNAHAHIDRGILTHPDSICQQIILARWEESATELVHTHINTHKTYWVAWYTDMIHSILQMSWLTLTHWQLITRQQCRHSSVCWHVCSQILQRNK